jgi:acetamidase/formamidase
MFGCGEAVGSGFVVREDVAADACGPRQLDRLRHTDHLNRDALEGVLDARGRHRRSLLLLAGGVLGLLAAMGPALKTALAAGGGGGGRAAGLPQAQVGRVHTVPSTQDTVRLGVFDSTLPNILEIDSGDVIVYPNTWSHFLNQVQPGVPIDVLAQLRRDNPGKGPHSIIGPVGVRGAEPGDMVAIHYQRLMPVDWGVTFVNPGDLGTGTLPDEFPDGQARYLNLDLGAMTAEFLPGINVPLGPFQGTFAVGPQEGGVVSSVPPGQHAGNVDLRELTEGSVLYIPVWQAGAKLFTGDSHAVQGDGEVNNQALESAMREVRVQIMLHKQAGWQWPFAETDTHWITLGMDTDLNEAFKIATRNTVDFLEQKAGLSRLDAYSLASIALSFRVTQFVDRMRGVHAMIPKSLFSEDLRNSISIV